MFEISLIDIYGRLPNVETCKHIIPSLFHTQRNSSATTEKVNYFILLFCHIIFSPHF